MPLRELDRAEYRGAVGQLLSPTDLFDGTVEENVSVGRPDVCAHDVLRAAERVGLSEWLQAQPRGLRTVVRNGGRELPTHVVRRLLVAQAVAGRPRLVLVDDYYQNVEPDCRQHLVECMTDPRAPWTLLLVSHDPAYLAACDRVLVLDGGRWSATAASRAGERHPAPPGSCGLGRGPAAPRYPTSRPMASRHRAARLRSGRARARPLRLYAPTALATGRGHRAFFRWVSRWSASSSSRRSSCPGSRTCREPGR